jgi:hypothetical protein
MADRDKVDMVDTVADMVADTVGDRDKDYNLHMDNMTYSSII